MADRTVKATLTADAGRFIRPVRAAAAAVDDLDRRFTGGRKSYQITADFRFTGDNVNSIARLSRLKNEQYRIGLHVDRTGATNAELETLHGILSRLPNKKTTKVDVNTGSAMSGVFSLGSAIATLGPAGLAAGAIAAGGLGALTTITTAAIAGGGAAILAFQGMGDAISAVNEYNLKPTAENAKKMQEALAGLTREGQSFARTVAGMRPELEKLKATAQRGLLPGAEEGLRSLTGIMPSFNNLIGRSAEALGQLAREGGAALSSPFWDEFFDFMAREAPPILLGLGRALGQLGRAWAGLSMAFAPLARNMVAGLENMARKFADWSTSLQTNQGFQEFLAYCRTNGPVLIDLLGQTARLLMNVVSAGMPVGSVILPILRDLISAFADLMGSDAGPVIMGVVAALGALRIASGVASMILGLGGALTKGATGASKFGLALGPLGLAVAAGAVAYGALKFSAEDASRAMEQGGKAASDARTELEANSREVQQSREQMGGWYGDLAEWARGITGIGTTMEQYNAHLREQLATMTPVERATRLAAEAQAVYDDALIKFGPNSRQAQDALVALRNAQADQGLQSQLANKTVAEYNATLGRLAQESGPAGDAARRLASGLDFAQLSAIGARVEIDKTGKAVAIMPNGKRIDIRADGRNAEVQIQAVSTSLDKVPPGKTVNVGALTASAQEALRRIGIEVDTLPDGTVNVTAKDAQARATLIAVANFGSSLTANPGIKANPAEFNRILDECLRAANVANGMAQINGDPAKFNAQRDAAIRSVEAANPLMPLDMNGEPAKLSLENVQRLAGTPQQFPLSTDGSPALGGVGAVHGQARAGQTFPHMANTAPAGGAVAGVHGQARVPQTFTHNANTAPANGGVMSVQEVARREQAFNVNANTSLADRAMRNLESVWNGARWVVNVVANKLGFAGGGPVSVAAGMADGGPIQRAANGLHVRSTRTLGTGRLVGPGSGTSDSIPIRAANGEWVVRARVARQQGAGLMAMLNAGLADVVPRQMERNTPRVVTIPAGMRGGNVSHTRGDIINNVEINNPRAERSSDDVQKALRKLASFGMFADG